MKYTRTSFCDFAIESLRRRDGEVSFKGVGSQRGNISGVRKSAQMRRGFSFNFIEHCNTVLRAIISYRTLTEKGLNLAILLKQILECCLCQQKMSLIGLMNFYSRPIISARNSNVGQFPTDFVRASEFWDRANIFSCSSSLLLNSRFSDPPGKKTDLRKKISLFPNILKF